VCCLLLVVGEELLIGEVEGFSSTLRRLRPQFHASNLGQTPNRQLIVQQTRAGVFFPECLLQIARAHTLLVVVLDHLLCVS
jgi:hypothetical protein